jgi:hypothetical protein
MPAFNVRLQSPPPSIRQRFLLEPPGHQALLALALALGVQVGQEYGQRLADDPPTIHGNAEGAERKPGTFQAEQLAAGQVDGDLLGVALPAAGLTPGFDGRTPARWPE